MLVGSQTKLLTAEEYAELPDPGDGSQQELVRGVVVTMPGPGFKHGRVCGRVVRKIGNFVEDRDLGYITCNDAGVILERSRHRAWAGCRLLEQGTPADPSHGWLS
ncbi:MAG: Uma2 family endonuclease [Gemmataceae bacterium]|nr:Uma2 family endonuclease [Gemmataceae bacterium]